MASTSALRSIGDVVDLAGRHRFGIEERAIDQRARGFDVMTDTRGGHAGSVDQALPSKRANAAN